MPRAFVADAKRRLSRMFALLNARIDELKTSDPHGSFRDHLIVSCERVRDALRRVEHAEEALVSNGTRDDRPSAA